MQGALELDDARMQQYMCMYTHMYMSIAIDSYNIPDSTYIYIYIYIHIQLWCLLCGLFSSLSLLLAVPPHTGEAAYIHYMYVKVLR